MEEDDQKELSSKSGVLSTAVGAVSTGKIDFDKPTVEQRVLQIEQYYLQRNGLLSPVPTDWEHVREIANEAMPLDLVYFFIDLAIARKKAKRRRPSDKIRTFSYCKTVIYGCWDELSSFLERYLTPLHLHSREQSPWEPQESVEKANDSKKLTSLNSSSRRRRSVEVVEVAQLYREIKKHFPFFDASVEKVKADYKYLKDFPVETAQENIDRYILTETVEPKIANIRGRLGDLQDSQRSKEAAAEHFANLDEWVSSHKPPPEGYWETVMRKLRGETNA